jgi:FAD:protein FMN transferase
MTSRGGEKGKQGDLFYGEIDMAFWYLPSFDTMTPTVAVARNAMATRFEIVLHGDNAVALRAAGEEALDEIEQIESRLSLYRPTSEIARVNAGASRGPVRVSPGVFNLLERTRILSEATSGAFDITIAPLVRCWGFMGGTGQMPQPDEAAEARARVGMSLVVLDPADHTVVFTREGVMIDLGAIGKGFALERAAELLRDAGVTSALLNAGTSTAFAIGHPPGEEHWKVAIESPPSPGNDEPRRIVAAVPLRDEAMSVSAVWGRAFESGGKRFGHVLDPRTGQPVRGVLLSAVALPSAAETDALSTALLVLGDAGEGLLAKLRPGVRTLVLTEDESSRGFRAASNGIAVCP